MANGQQSTYDLSSVAQDADFLKASPQDQIAYLSAHDPDLAKASPQDKAAYLNHILGHDQPTSVERAGVTPSRWDAANEVAGKMLSGAGLPTSISDIPEWGKRLLGQTPESKPFWQPFVDAYKAPTQRNLVSAVPFIGPSAVSAADEPTLLGKAASLVGTAGSVVGGGEIKPGLKSAGAEVADAVRTPENKLTPKAAVAARVGGAIAGHAIGVPGAGELAGVLGGPSLADAFLPKRPETPNFFGGSYQEPALTPFKGPYEPITKSPYYPQMKAAYKAVQTPTTSAVPTIIRPATTGEPLFSGSEGRAATWTNQDVQRLAAQGNREAIQQAVRRGMQLPANARYVMGDPDFSRAVYNPRESTIFTPEGTPIRNRESMEPSSRKLIEPAGYPYSPPVEQPDVASPYGPPQTTVTDPAYSRTGGNGGPYVPAEDAMEAARRGAPSINPAERSLRRNVQKRAER